MLKMASKAKLFFFQISTYAQLSSNILHYRNLNNYKGSRHRHSMMTHAKMTYCYMNV